MLSTAVIVFREALEIFLILGVILAATHRLPGRLLWIGLGLLGGIIGAGLVALFAEGLSESLAGTGQELFNAGVMFTAALCIGWTALWVRGHARAAAAELKQTGAAIAAGKMPFYALSLIIGLSLLREGAEIALFLYSQHIGGEPTGSIAAGAAVGALGGGAVGLLFSYGLVKLPTRWALSATTWLLVLLVGGLVAQGVGFLSAAGYLSGWSHQVWNSTWLLAEDSVVGKVLHGLIGYTARPTTAQVAAYGVTCGGLALAMWSIGRQARSAAVVTPTPSTPVTKLAVLALVLTCATGQARALDNIDTPYVVEGELALEYTGSSTFDREADRNHIQSHGLAVEYGLTERVLVEVKAEFEKVPDESMILEEVEAETRIQIFERGEHPIDLGVLLAYGFAAESEHPDVIEGKLLLGADTGRFSHLANLGLEKEIGQYAEPGDPEASAILGSRYRWLKECQPGIEYQADLGSNLRDFKHQEHYLGPDVSGRFGSALVYQASFCWGLSDAAADRAARILLEYEFHP
jgi:high-affinity iron transporter